MVGFMVATIGSEIADPGYDSYLPDDEIVEVSLQLPRWQIEAMESVASKRGMNLGQMLRRMIGATFEPKTSSLT